MTWNWYGVKTLFRQEALGKPKKPDQYYDHKTTMMEERVVLVKARNIQEAIMKGEKEARSYARELQCVNPYGQRVQARYLEHYDCFEISDLPNVGVEVFSMMGLVNRHITDDRSLDWRFGFRSDIRKDNDNARKKFRDYNLQLEIMNIAVKYYFKVVPKERKARVKKIHSLILQLYPKAFVSMAYKMPTYHIGERWVGLANQKQYVSLYTCGYHHIEGFKKKHPTIKAGKGCINFQDKDRLPLADVKQVIMHAMRPSKHAVKKK